LVDVLVDLTKADLQRQYDLAVGEYRFQVDLNWRRSEYFFVLNIGVLIAASTLVASHKIPRLLVAAVFLVGLLLALLSILANETQTSYYHSARDLKRRLEDRLDIRELALATTPGMGSSIRRLGRVGTFLKIMLAAIALTDLIGAGLIAHEQWWESAPHRTVVVLTPGSPDRFASGARPTVVVARNGQVIATREPSTRGAYHSIELEAGRYDLWTASSQRCRATLLVRDAPVQLAVPPC
jgi:hypothetical protein